MQEHEPLVRVAALHALAYCERLFYLEEVEEIRVADERVYAGRTMHIELSAEEAVEQRTLALSSERLGLTGRLDALRHRDGWWYPYEHKKGRPMRRKGSAPLPWPSDQLQVLAYAMLLEESVGEPVPEGRIRYHAENLTVRVPLHEAGRLEVSRAVERARDLRSRLERPAVHPNSNRCIHCSLAPVCLPEEERLSADPDWEPVRLLPAHREGKVLHVSTQGAQVGRSSEQIVVRREGTEEQTLSCNDLSAIVLHGYAQISTQAIQPCATSDIAVHWVSGGGQYCGALASGAGAVQRRLRQYRALADESFARGLARRVAAAKVESQLRYLLRGSRVEAERRTACQELIQTLRAALRGIARSVTLDEIRGHEGNAARVYFTALPTLLTPEVPEEFQPAGRNRRPPRDRFNTLLSFGYSMLYRSVLQAILAVGLEPALGFYHTPRSSAHPLALDLIELFRVALWDLVVIGSLNRRQWCPVGDFSIAGDRVWLSDAGRRKAIELYENRLQECWRHPVTQYSLSYERAIELEVRLLEKEWTGTPGLFARMRLR